MGSASLLRQLVDQLKADPQKEAYRFVVDADHIQVLTYGQLLDRAGTVSHELTRHGQKPSRALLIFQPGFDFIYALFGCFLSNTAAIPVAIPKPRTTDLFTHFIEHADPDVILTTSDLSERISALLAHRRLRIVEVDKLEDSDKSFSILATSESIALIQYTSGSTASPKGVTINFENLRHNLQAIKDHFGLSEQSVCFSWLPHYHDMGLVDGLLTPLFNRCAGILTTPIHVVGNPKNWLKAIGHFKVTHTGGPNFIFDLCVDRIPKEDTYELNLRSLSHVYVSAEPVRKQTLERFSNHFKESGFHPNLFTPGYGLAEATLMVTCKPRSKPLTFHTLKTEGKSTDYVGLGRTIPGIDLKIVDPESLITLPEGKIGEIMLSGPTITSGYFNDPEASQRTMVDLTYHNKTKKYLRTGDLGFIVNDELFITGRIKDTLLIRGIQYQAEDLEYAISACHPDIVPGGTAVFSINFEKEERAVVLQEIKRQRWDSYSSREVQNKIREAIHTAFGLSLHDIIFVPQGAIPKTTSGKIKRSESRHQYLNGKFSQPA